MTIARNSLIKQLWHGTDPFQGFPAGLFAPDTQGWNSNHPYLVDSIIRKRPEFVVELGVWKGASTLTLAAAMRDAGVNGVVIAVDTWLGSWDHWANPAWAADLCPTFGYPNLYYKFASNVIQADLQDYVIPLPLDSANATRLLSNLGIAASLIHIDGAHDYKSTNDDLMRWWEILSYGGEMIVDDYDGNGKIWPEVGQAVNDFRRTASHDSFEWEPYKCRIKKT